MESNDIIVNNVRLECHHNKFHCYGKSFLYGERVNKYERRLRIISFTGIVVPLMLGGYALTYGNEIPQIFIIIGGAILMLQLYFSALSLVYKWDDELSYSLEATRDHNLLSQDFEILGKFPPSKKDDLLVKYNILKERLKSRNEQDVKHDLNNKERVKGMRWALREFQKECSNCKEIPYSMERTSCPVCGKY